MSRRAAIATLHAWRGHKDTARGTLRANAWTCEQLPGVVVRHCGHPTAIRPYYVEGSHGPLGTHSLLSAAQLAAELDAYCFERHGAALADADPDCSVWRGLIYGDGLEQLRRSIDALAV